VKDEEINPIHPVLDMSVSCLHPSGIRSGYNPGILYE